MRCGIEESCIADDVVVELVEMERGVDVDALKSFGEGLGRALDLKSYPSPPIPLSEASSTLIVRVPTQLNLRGGKWHLSLSS